VASGDVLSRWQAKDGEPPSTTPAILEFSQNRYFTYTFEASADALLDFSDTLDRKYSGGGITLILCWAAGASSGNVVWTAAFERHQDEVDALHIGDSFASAQSIIAAVATNIYGFQYSTIQFTNAQIDGLLIGEDFRLRITRDADNASDTCTAIAYLKSIEMRET
jgi:hypothetical protein